MKQEAWDDVVKFAVAHETAWDRHVDGKWGVHRDDPEPWNRLLGPVHDRGPVSGVVSIGGKTVLSWGEPDRADLTFSIAKTYLALLAGVAVERGLIRDVHDPIQRQLPGIGFDDDHNRSITWEHMLHQTSEWKGVCFDFSDQADHYRSVTFGQPTGQPKGTLREHQAPGSYWEYNDVRINQFSLALLHLFGRPLPEVFDEAIMQPLGATSDWRWVGYDNAWVDINGQRMQSVPGGTHWGGGMSVSARDQVRIGEMMLHNGMHQGRELISSSWLQAMRTPCELAPYYGYLLWLNTDQAIFPSVPASSTFGIGAGSSFCWMEPERDLVVVVRWLDAAAADPLFARVLAAIDS